jgi:hypothetical protein
MTWLLWAVLLIVQNFSFTMVSRARNSGSILYHGIAAIFSNGVWFASMFIIVDSINHAIKDASLARALLLGLFYTACTVAGSLSSHYILMRWVEKGRRKIGS